jgi:protein O-GlcNAc transferase
VNELELTEAHREWWRRFAPGPPLPAIVPSGPDRPLRVGFVSADFCKHSVAYFSLPLIARLSEVEDAITPVLYSNTKRADAVTEEFKKCPKVVWRSVIGVDDEAMASMIREDRIDILIDLGGHTADSRLTVFSKKAAPIQVSYVGYALTSGSPFIDYRITDHTADPIGMTEQHFTEQLWRLPRCAWVYRPTIPPEPQSKAPSSKGERFTFGATNAIAKWNPPLLDAWAAILKGCPKARLFMKGSAFRDKHFGEHVLKQFTDRGITVDQLLFDGWEGDHSKHLQRLKIIDLNLDTFPYSGTTTTCESILMGVPMLTMVGKTHRSRVSASLLRSLGREHMQSWYEALCTESPEAYVKRAIRYYQEPGMLDSVRHYHRGHTLNELLDESGFAQAFAEAMRGMWRKAVADATS